VKVTEHQVMTAFSRLLPRSLPGLFSKLFSRSLLRARRLSGFAAFAFAAFFLLFAAQSVIAQPGGERLDALERQRLRMELRQRAQDERVRGQPPVQFQQAPVPAYPASGGYGAPMNGPSAYRAEGGPRLSPEERQQLRMQLREGRR
jgi:hypothetical protein